MPKVEVPISCESPCPVAQHWAQQSTLTRALAAPGVTQQRASRSPESTRNLNPKTPKRNLVVVVCDTAKAPVF